MRLFLIRHAQSQNNAQPEELRVEDPSLTPLGREQARLLAHWISALELTRVITSPFRRSLETAEAIRRATALAPEVRTALHETGGCYRGHAGAEMVGRPGMSRAEIEREFPGFAIAPEIDGQGWWGCKPRETDAEANLRAQLLWEQTIAEFGSSDERIALVMHADFKLALLKRFHATPLLTPWNTSVTTVAVEASTAHLTDYNSVRHLPPELVTV
jgi:2,3-bisphosphoglycerate-dependent phosphoglycerate mutase